MDLKKTSILPLRCLCVPDMPLMSLVKRIQKLSPENFDVVEFGVESVIKKDLANIRKKISHPIILAARGKKLTAQKIMRYVAAIKNGWDWVDIDIQSNRDHLQKIIKEIEKARRQKRNVKLILSMHDSDATVSTRMIIDWIEEMRRIGKKVPALPKVVTKIIEFQDILRLRNIALSYAKRNIGIILHGSGEKGRESRLIQAIAGSAMIYLCLNSRLRTAKGQWTIADWNRTMRELGVT